MNIRFPDIIPVKDGLITIVPYFVLILTGDPYCVSDNRKPDNLLQSIKNGASQGQDISNIFWANDRERFLIRPFSQKKLFL